MANYYADAIEVIADSLSLEQLNRIAVDYAKRHPKAFVMAAGNAGNKNARHAMEKSDTAELARAARNGAK